MLYIGLFYYVALLFTKEKLTKKMQIVLSLLPILLIIWTRYGLGADYFSYNEMYLKLGSGSLIQIFSIYKVIEPGFKFFMWLSSTIGLSFYFFIGILNSVLTYFAIKWIDENSKNAVMSVMLFFSMFFIVWILSALRQSIVLVFSLYFLFNRKRDSGPVKSALLIMFLALFHKSALVLFILYPVRYIKWNKKTHLILLSIALISSLLPLGTILSYVDFIPGVSRIVENYLSYSYVFYDFPGLVRLLFFASVLIFYDKLTEDKFFVDYFLFGISLYFIMKFSELTAARSTIYTFIMIVILVPSIVDTINEMLVEKTKYINVVLTMFVVAGSFVYFNKEVKTVFRQAEYVGEVYLITYPNIFTSHITDFGSLSAYELNFQDSNADFLDKVIEKGLDRVEVNYNESDSYVLIEENDQYGFINQDGDYLVVPRFKYAPELVDGILVKHKFAEGDFFKSIEYQDLTDKNRSKSEMNQIYLNSPKDIINNVETDVSIEFEIPDIIMSYYPSESSISNMIVKKIDGSNIYYVMRVEYNGKRSFIYFNEERELLIDIPFKGATQFDNNGFIYLSSYDYNLIINESGKIVWIEK